VRVFLDEGDRLLGERLELAADLLALGLRPLMEGVLEERGEELAEVLSLRGVDDVRKLPDRLLDEALEVLLRPDLDAADLFSDLDAALLDRACGACEVLFEHLD